MASGNDLLNKPALDQRITAPCGEAAGAVAHLCYKWNTTDLDMDLAGADDVVHGIAVTDSVQDAEGTFDTAGIVICIASGAIDKGDEVQAAASGQVKTQAGGKWVLGYAMSKAANGEKVSVKLR
jgi:hypothetical protein